MRKNMTTKTLKRHSTFADVLKEVRIDNAKRLMEKARIFNTLAKTSESEKKVAVAYHWKNRYLNQLLSKFHNDVYVVADDICHFEGVMLVHLKGDSRGLHTHQKWLNQS